ncbi:hypothetical protein [Pedobacter sp.]|uniref:hypothetical protein n=1 Tax=Pedobacter sp. TaxID=1411316 RepID=UPI003D7F8C22
MSIKNNEFLKLWGMPIWMAVITLIGLISAILGTGFWHVLSWIVLTIPVYIMIKHGKKFFKSKTHGPNG